MNFKSLLGTASLALLIGTAQASAQQITIGHLQDFSGPTADVGTPYGQAVVDTFAWVNKNGGIGGKHGDGTAATDPSHGQAAAYPFRLLVDILPAERNRVGEGAPGQVPW